VTPAPRLWHQELAVRLARTVSEYLEREPVGHLLPSPADISWTSDTLVQPDLFVAPLDQVRTLDWTQVKDLLLVIEVLSPSTLRYDRFTKRRLYQGASNPKLLGCRRGGALGRGFGRRPPNFRPWSGNAWCGTPQVPERRSVSSSASCSGRSDGRVCPRIWNGVSPCP